MAVNPLDYFLSEKTAGELSKTTEHKPLDSGERALVGIAIQSSLAARAIPFVGQQVLKVLAESGSEPAKNFPRYKDITSLKLLRKDSLGNLDFIDAVEPKARTKLLGLFDVSSRTDIPTPPVTNVDFERAKSKVYEIQPVVDSFFQKHKLGEKGVTMSIRSGLISEGLGPHYDLSNKRVSLPILSEPIALHELGHAADYTTRIGKVRAAVQPYMHSFAMTGVPIALVAGDEIARMIPGTMDDKAIKFMQDNAPEIMGATLAATHLYPEAKASFLALKHIKDVRGTPAMWDAAKRLLPAWGTYALAVIPPIVGMALARKYMNEARATNQAHEKKAGVGEWIGSNIRGLGQSLSEWGKDFWHVGKEITRGTGELLSDPHAGSRILQASKEVGTSPHFVHSALATAIPATIGAYYLYATDAGKHMRDHMTQIGIRPTRIVPNRPTDENWREQNPATFAGIVGLGTALSAGILSRFINDLKEVL